MTYNVFGGTLNLTQQQPDGESGSGLQILVTFKT